MKYANHQSQTAFLRGGRMTKYKGQAASFAPSLGRILSSVSVAAVGATLVFGDGAAQAGSCADQGGGEFLCSGAEDLDNLESTIEIIDSDNSITVTTEPEFGINADGNAFTIDGGDSVTVTDENGSLIKGSDGGIEIKAENGVSVTTTGIVEGNEFGISVENSGQGAVSINVADVTAQYGVGILANSDSEADISVTASGLIEALAGGVGVDHGGAGNVTINVENVTSYYGDGVDVNLGGAGNVTIDVENVTSYDGDGVNVTRGSDADGDVTITASGLIDVSGDGVEVDHSGAGNVTITASGLIQAGDDGVVVDHEGLGDVTIAVQDVTSADDGIRASLKSVSNDDVTITASGSIDAGSNGINVDHSGSGDVTIVVQDVTSVYDGIYAYLGTGDGDLSITSSGLIQSSSDGVFTTQYSSGNATIAVQDVTSAVDGINAFLKDEGGDVTISASGLIQASENGVVVDHDGAGNVTIAVNYVNGDNGFGIVAENYVGTNISITTSGDVAGRTGGIRALNTGTGFTNVAVSGNVSSVEGPAIQAESLTTSTIELLDGAVVASANGQAIVNGGDDGTVILRDGSSISGSIEMNEGADRLIVEGGSDIGGATVFSGGGGTEDALVFSDFSGTFDSAVFTDWESLTAQNGGTLELVSADTGTIEEILIDTGAEIVVGNPAFASAAELQVNATARFLAGVGGAGDVSFAKAVRNDGLISTADGKSGDTFSIGGDLTGNGTVALDVDLTNGINDEVFVGGNTEEAKQLLDVVTSGSTGEQAKDFTLVTVEGNNSAVDFSLASADLITNDGAQAIIDGEIVYQFIHDATAGEFILSPFDNGELLLNPGGDFLAAGVEQFSRHLTFGSALDRVVRGTPGSEAGALTISQMLDEYSNSTLAPVWAQAVGQSSSYTIDGREVDTNLGELRVGTALPSAELAGGRLVGGFEFGVSDLSSDVVTKVTSGTIATKAYDLTLNALWVADSKFYTDVQLRYANFDSTISLNGRSAVDVEGSGFGASLEMGMPFEMQNGLTLTPQVQVAYSDVDIDDVNNLAGGGVRGALSDGDNLTARIGLRADKTFANGSTLYGQIDYYHAFDNTTSVTFGSNTIETARDRDSVALTLGGNIVLSQNTSLFGEITAETSLGGGANDHSLSAALGLQIRF